MAPDSVPSTERHSPPGSAADYIPVCTITTPHAHSSFDDPIDCPQRPAAVAPLVADTALDCVLGDCDWRTATSFPHCIDEYLQHLKEAHDADAA